MLSVTVITEKNEAGGGGAAAAAAAIRIGLSNLVRLSSRCLPGRIHQRNKPPPPTSYPRFRCNSKYIKPPCCTGNVGQPEMKL